MPMRALRFLNLAILSVLIGCSALVYAQDDKPQENKPPQQEEPKPQPKPDEMKPQDEAKPHPDEAKPSKQEKQEQKQEQKQGLNGHPEQQAGPAGKGGHIPDDKFHAHFGRSHTFTARTVIVQGQPRFQYGGYSFQLVDAWPMGWAYTDDCYIDYIDGEYFLFDLLHPGVRVAVFVVM
jgi:hypothetical protein